MAGEYGDPRSPQDCYSDSLGRAEDRDEWCENAFADASAASDLHHMHGATVEEIEARLAAGQRGWGVYTPHEALAAYGVANAEADQALAEDEAAWVDPDAVVAPKLSRQANIAMEDGRAHFSMLAADFAERVVVCTYEDAGLHAEAAAFQLLTANGVTDADQLEAAITALCASPACSGGVGA